ncbi:MAG: hypothetical protein ACRETD_00970 [Steroidobacteraceae bacterium]
MAPTDSDDRWPHIAALLASPGGHITLGRVAPIEGAAVAVNDQALLVTLVRRDDESVHALLRRLDDAIGQALHQGFVTNEINGGRFRLAPSHVRKTR